MSIECGECERDLRGGHAEDCSRNKPLVTPKAESESSKPTALELAKNMGELAFAVRAASDVYAAVFLIAEYCGRHAKALIRHEEGVEIDRHTGIFSSPCPVCRKRYPGANDNYCPNCGTKLKWKD